MLLIILLHDRTLDVTTSTSWLEKIQKTVLNLLQVVNVFQTPVNRSGSWSKFWTLLWCLIMYKNI